MHANTLFFVFVEVSRTSFTGPNFQATPFPAVSLLTATNFSIIERDCVLRAGYAVTRIHASWMADSSKWAGHTAAVVGVEIRASSTGAECRSFQGGGIIWTIHTRGPFRTHVGPLIAGAVGRSSD